MNDTKLIAESLAYINDELREIKILFRELVDNIKENKGGKS